MTRRQIHQSVAMGVTLAVMAWAIYFFIATDRRLSVFLMGCGAYLVFFLVFWLVCWLNVPRDLRRRPAMPGEFQFLWKRKISATPQVEAILSHSTLVQDRTFGSKRHKFYELEQPFPEGTWSCLVEEVSGEIIACLISFKSVSSPVLDFGKQHGQGRFLTVSG